VFFVIFVQYYWLTKGSGSSERVLCIMRTGTVYRLYATLVNRMQHLAVH
jgi:hypothetical protein